jgi:hypothetical protein
MEPCRAAGLKHAGKIEPRRGLIPNPLWVLQTLAAHLRAAAVTFLVLPCFVAQFEPSGRHDDLRLGQLSPGAVALVRVIYVEFFS